MNCNHKPPFTYFRSIHKRVIPLIALVSLVTSSSLLAHTNGDMDHSSGLLAGFMHPFMGLDHLAAMLAVGLWSALVLRSKRILLVPLAFVSMLICGAVAALLGLDTPAIEPLIASSLLILGLFIAFRKELPLGFMLLLVSVFAVFHGLAHGHELAKSNSLSALSGMVLATVLLHLIGVGFGHMVLNHRRWQQALGASVALFGGFGLLHMFL